MEEHIDTESELSLARRKRSFAYALRGLYLFIQTTPNVWIHLTVFIGAIVIGAYLDISITDWMFLLLAAGLVLSAEAFNTAIEIDINLTSPEFHPYARDTKDVAAAAVLITSIFALLIGILIFFKYLPFYD